MKPSGVISTVRGHGEVSAAEVRNIVGEAAIGGISVQELVTARQALADARAALVAARSVGADTGRLSREYDAYSRIERAFTAEANDLTRAAASVLD